MTIRYIIIVEKSLKPAIKGNTDEEIQKIILHGMHACAVTCSMRETGHG
jgi:alkylhydroperoxidase/carboxymuconolactone decarboxylase family protein YurZ